MFTATPRWKAILQRNNDAIDRIQESQLCLGIQILRDVLQEMKGLVKVVPSLSRNDKGITTTTAAMVTSKAAVLLHTVTLSKMQRSSYQDTASPSNSFHLYNRAFKCFNVTLKNAQEESEAVTSLVIVVLYNLGLAMHLHSLLHDHEGVLRKALALYNLAASKAIPLLSHGNRRIDSHLFKLTIALYNNQGHIHSRLGDVQQARECFFQIERTVSTSVHQSVVLVMDDSDYFFCRHYYMLFLLFLGAKFKQQ
jgi:tetratricopeptide (TPR) repeat protein